MSVPPHNKCQHVLPRSTLEPGVGEGIPQRNCFVYHYFFVLYSKLIVLFKSSHSIDRKWLLFIHNIFLYNYLFIFVRTPVEIINGLRFILLS